MPTLTSSKIASFQDFTLNGEMKRLQSKGIGSTLKQAETLTEEEEEQL